MVHDFEKPVKQRRLCLTHDHVVKGACVEQQQKVRQILSQLCCGLVVLRRRRRHERDNVPFATTTKRLIEQLLQEMTQLNSYAYTPDFVREVYGALILCWYWCWYNNKGKRRGSEEPRIRRQRRHEQSYQELSEDRRDVHGRTSFATSSTHGLDHEGSFPIDGTTLRAEIGEAGNTFGPSANVGEPPVHDDNAAAPAAAMLTPTHPSPTTTTTTTRAPTSNNNGSRHVESDHSIATRTNDNLQHLDRQQEPGLLSIICKCLDHLQQYYNSHANNDKKNDYDDAAELEQMEKCWSIRFCHDRFLRHDDKIISSLKNPVQAILSLRLHNRDNPNSSTTQQQQQQVQKLLLRTWIMRSSLEFQGTLEELDTGDMQRLLSLLLKMTNMMPTADNGLNDNKNVNLLAARVLLKCMRSIVTNNSRQDQTFSNSKKQKNNLRNITTAEVQAIALQVLLRLQHYSGDGNDNDDEEEEDSNFDMIHHEAVQFLCYTLTLRTTERTGMTINIATTCDTQQQEQADTEKHSPQQHQHHRHQPHDSDLELQHDIDVALARILGDSYTCDSTKRTILLHYFQRLAMSTTSASSSLARVPQLVESLARVASKRSTHPTDGIIHGDDDDGDDHDNGLNILENYSEDDDDDDSVAAATSLVDTRDNATLATVLLFELSKDVSNKRILAKQSGVLACLIRHVRDNFVSEQHRNNHGNRTHDDPDDDDERKRLEWKEQIMTLAAAL